MIGSRRVNTAVLAALLALCAGQLVFAMGKRWLGDGTTITGTGLLLLGCMLAYQAFRAQATTNLSAETARRPTRRARIGGIVGIMLLATVLRIAWLDRLPFRIDGDAAAFALAAADYLAPEPPPLIGTGWQSHTNLLFFLQSLVIRVFGRTVLGIRGLSALGGVLGVLAIFALGRSLWNWRVGLFAALVAAVLPFHLVFSRVGTEVIHLGWLLPLVTLSIYNGWQRRSILWLAAGGAVAGLSQYFYPGARLIPILVVVQISLLFWLPADTPNALRKSTGWKWLFAALGASTLGFMLVYAPMIVHFIEHPDIYTARIKIVSITSSGWLDQQLEQRPLWQVLGEQVRRAYLPFVYPVGGPQLWYVWPQYLGVVDAALLLLGLVGIWASAGVARWLRYYLLIYLVLGIFLGGVMTIDTPMPSRYMIFIPAIVLLIGWALDHVVQHSLHLFGQWWKGIGRGVVAAALTAYAANNIGSYIQHDSIATWSADPTGQMATYTAHYLQTLPDQQFDVYFLQTPMMHYQASPVLPFLIERPGTNVPEPTNCAMLTRALGPKQSVVIAPPGRIDELKQISEQLPAADFEVFHNPQGVEVGAILHIAAPAPGSDMCAEVAANRASR